MNGVDLMDSSPQHASASKEVATLSGLLSRKEIMDYNLIIGKDGNPIHDSESEIEKAPSGSYDLHIGDRHFLFESTGRWKPVFLGTPEELRKVNDNVDSSLQMQLSEHGYKNLVIPPFCSAIIQLQETVDLYTVANNDHLMIAGRFDLKLSAIYKGLISQQATQVEPCYRGKLYCFVHNLGEQEITLTEGDKVATIEFSYVGQGLSSKEREEIIKRTINYNATEKYKGESFTHSIKIDEKTEIHTGIGDIRWLKESRLPNQCGIAPIYNLVTGNVNEQVDKHLEKSSTIESLSDRVSNRIKERESSLRTVLLLVLAVITFFTTNLAIELRAELRYFSEELAFFAERYASLIDTNGDEEADFNDSTSEDGPSSSINPSNPDDLSSFEDSDNSNDPSSSNNSGSIDSANALEAIKAHTEELSRARTSLLKTAGLALVIIVALLLYLFFKAFSPSGEQKWIRKRRKLEAEYEYLNTKKRILSDNTVEQKRCCIFKEKLRSKDEN